MAHAVIALQGSGAILDPRLSRGLMKTRAAGISTLAILALGVGCRDSRSFPLPSELAPINAASTDASAPWRAIVEGETGPGTMYRIYMPENWNHKLVVYAQGLVPPFFHASLPAE